MDKQFLQEHSLEEVAKQFDDELKEYVEQVNKIEDKNVILEMEESINKEHEEVNDYIKEVVYTLPNDVEFEGKKYSINDVVKRIVYFINKSAVKWEYVPSCRQFIRYWKRNNPSEVTYGAYDSTLRTLGSMTFVGDTEWTDIMIVNEYLKSAHERYSKDTSWVLFVSEKHNALMDRLKQLDQIEAEIKPAE